MVTRIAAGTVSDARQWRLSAAGHFAIADTATGSDAAPRTRKAKAVLAALCAQPGRRFTRERIAAMLWGDRGEAQARASLRQALLEIRQALGEGSQLIQTDRTCLWADPASLQPSELDATPWANSDLALYDDLDHITPEFDEWLLLERADRQAALGRALRSEAEKLLSRGRGAAALPLIDRLERLEPYDEDVLRLAMRAESQAGRPAAVRIRFQSAEDRLRDDLGVPLSTETRALHEDLIEDLGRAPDRTEARSRPAPASEPEIALRARPKLARRTLQLLAGVAALLLIGIAAYLTGSRTTAPASIAVLPFEAGKGADPNLADGLSQELLARMSLNRGFRVIGRTSAWQFKGRSGDLRVIGRQLGVGYLVRGSIAGDGDRMRVTASLVDQRDGSVLWSRTYSGAEQDAQAIEKSIATEVARRLGIQSSARFDRQAKSPAYPLYLRALALFRQRTDVSLQASRNLLLAAVHDDPGFAPAWAYIGGATRLLEQDQFLLDPGDPDGPSMTSRQAVERALALDPQLPDAHAMLGLIAGSDTVEGQQHIRRAAQLDPADPQIQYFWSAALARQGNFAAAARAAYASAALDPLWSRSVEAAASARLNVGDSRGAERYLRTIRAANPDGADEVETSIAMQRSDVSHAVEIGLRNKFRDHGAGAFDAGFGLYALGFEREGILVGKLKLLSSIQQHGHASDLPALIRLARETSTTGESFNFYLTALWSLAADGRYADIAALYDARQGVMSSFDQATFANRGTRREFAAILSVALQKAGRTKEAVRMRGFADEADRVTLANGEVPPDILVNIAENEAMLGRSARALDLLDKAFAAGWRIYWNGTDFGRNPAFASLRGDPRFGRLAALSRQHKEKERREVEALNLL